MTLRWQCLCIDVADPSAAAAFWESALGWRRTHEEPDEVVLEPPAGSPEDGVAPDLLFSRLAEDKVGKNRLHLDLRPEDQGAEVARLEQLGARRIDIGQGDVSWVVMADPFGNEFCVLRAYQTRRAVEWSDVMSRHVQVTFDAHDPRALSTFWSQVLGYVIPGPPGSDLPRGADPWPAWEAFLEMVGVPEAERNAKSAIEDPDGVGPRLFFQQVPEDKVAKNRVHLDVRAAPGLQGDERMVALEAEADRLVALGANRVRRFEPAPPLSAGHLVMADPEGNEFCLD